MLLCERDDMSDSSAIVLATFVGVLGYILGLQKLKAETIWKEKYDVLKSLTEETDQVLNLASHEELIGLGIDTISSEELELLTKDVVAAKKNIRKSISNLEILFKEKQIRAIIDQYQSLIGLIAKLEDSKSGAEFRADLHSEVQGTARLLQLEVIKLAKKKIT